MIKSLPKHKTLLFISQNEYNPNIGGYHKTTHKIIKTVIALSYFLCKKQIKQRIYNQKLVNRNNISTRKDREI